MLINTSDIKDGSIPLGFTEDIVIPEAYSVQGNTAQLLVKGRLISNEGFYTLDAEIFADLCLKCALCLTTVEHRLEFSINERFSDSLQDDDEIWNFNGKIIDITPALLSNLLLNLPMKVLCSESCKGFCAVCGKDLNLSACGCNESYVDPRWLALFEKEV